MSASNFKPSLALVLAHEGGFVNHPRDPGGATNNGVTQAVYDAYRRYNGLAVRSVRYITELEIADIYHKNYWKLCRADSLPCGLDYAVFDFAVNSGVSRAVRYLQMTVKVDADGVLGVKSMAAIDGQYKRDPLGLIAHYCANRMAFLRKLRNFDVFGKGWTRRVIGYKPGAQDGDKGVIDYATAMVKRAAIAKLPTTVANISGKAELPVIAEPSILPTSAPISSAEQLRAMALDNDKLAAIING